MQVTGYSKREICSVLLLMTLTVLWKLALVVFTSYTKGVEMLKIENIHDMSKAGHFGSKLESKFIIFITMHENKTMQCVMPLVLFYLTK